MRLFEAVAVGCELEQGQKPADQEGARLHHHLRKKSLINSSCQLRKIKDSNFGQRSDSKFILFSV
jgi:hypothetical protein